MKNSKILVKKLTPRHHVGAFYVQQYFFQPISHGPDRINPKPPPE